jgi:hypothetical protein
MSTRQPFPQRIDEATVTDGIVVSGDIIPHEPDPGNHRHGIWVPTKPWLKGCFVSFYANNVLANDSSGTSRRILLEGDSVTVLYNEMEKLPFFSTWSLAAFTTT